MTACPLRLYPSLMESLASMIRLCGVMNRLTFFIRGSLAGFLILAITQKNLPYQSGLSSLRRQKLERGTIQ